MSLAVGRLQRRQTSLPLGYTGIFETASTVSGQVRRMDR